MANYFRYGWVMFLTGPLTYSGFLAGGVWCWIGILLPLSVMLAGDFFLPLNYSTPEFKHPWILNVFLFVEIPMTIFLIFLLGWKVTPGDLASLGSLAQQLSGIDVLARREQLPVLSTLGALASGGFLLSANFFIAHELIHRNGPLSQWGGKWLLAAVGDTQFIIAHLYQHHKHVGTLADPATARRGESLYRFMFRSTRGQFVSAWQIEQARLSNAGQAVWSASNRFLTGQAMTLFIIAVAGWGMSWQALLAFLVCVAISKALYETVNYVQHYGLVRVPGTPVEPRHSWDCNAHMSSSFLLNLTRHSDHHARGDVPFWDLLPVVQAPTHYLGYFPTFFIAMVPAAWKKHIALQLEHWDRNLATPSELALLKEQTK